MTLILRLTDGTTTLNLNDLTNYAIPDEEWVPAVGRRASGELGGRGVYEPVEETIPLHVRGATGAAALTNLANLGELLDQAESWARGEDVAAVKLQYRPHNSNLGSDLQAVVLSAPGRDAFMGLSKFVNSATNLEIPGIQLKLVRGDWLETGGIQTSGGVTNPGIITATSFPAALDYFSPTDVLIAGFDGSVVPSLIKGFVLIADDANALFLDEAEDGTNTGGGGGLGTISDTAVSGASGGTVVRIAPTGIISTFSITFTLSGSKLLEGKNIAFYAMIKNNSPDISYTAWGVARYGDSSFQSGDIETRKVTIPANSGPQMHYLGMISLVEQPHLIRYQFRPDDASVGSGDELDVDYCAAISLADPGKRVLRLENSNMGGSGSLSLGINTRVLERPQPTVWQLSPSPFFLFLNTVPYGGDPFYVSKGAAISVLPLGTNGTGNWLIETGAGAADQLSTLITRYPLHLVAE